jgi:hypothetical protein
MKYLLAYFLGAALLTTVGSDSAQAQTQQQIPQAAPSTEPAPSAQRGGAATEDKTTPSADRVAQPPKAEGMAPGADKTPTTGSQIQGGGPAARDKP